MFNIPSAEDLGERRVVAFAADSIDRMDIGYKTRDVRVGIKGQKQWNILIFESPEEAQAAFDDAIAQWRGTP